jgi:general secretion pathway protein C
MWTQLNLEQLSRKYFWAVHLVFILLVAYVAARTANLFVEAAITPLPSTESPRAVTRATPVRTVTPLNLERVAKLTGLTVPQEPEVVEPGEQTADDMQSKPVKTSLRVKLLGTLLAVRPQWSLASILDTGTNRAQTYMVGDKLEGADVLEIERERVIILNSHRREYIDGEAGSGAVVAYNPPPPRGTEPPHPSVLGTGIRALSENEYEVPRGEIDKTLSNLNDVAMQARIVPAFKDGQAQGFKLFAIRPDSIYTKIGIQNGDVIQKINGYELNSPEKALEVYTKLKEANRIDIEYERNGVKGHKTYTIH